VMGHGVPFMSCAAADCDAEDASLVRPRRVAALGPRFQSWSQAAVGMMALSEGLPRPASSLWFRRLDEARSGSFCRKFTHVFYR